MNSCLYEVDIRHWRLAPREHKFNARIFMFYLDLDEIDQIPLKVHWIAHNRRNIYELRDKDHLFLNKPTLKENIVAYARSCGVEFTGGKIMLLTNLRTLGYIFNPVSFYFCFDQYQKPLWVIAEIGNTFGELKPFFLGREALKDGTFMGRQVKYFYISPFTDLDVVMDFRIKIPSEKLDIWIDDWKGDHKFFLSSMRGEKKELNNWNIFWYSLHYPWVTLKVIGLIHWHALLLFLKKIPFHRKEEGRDLQKGVYREWRKGSKKSLVDFFISAK